MMNVNDVRKYKLIVLITVEIRGLLALLAFNKQRKYKTKDKLKNKLKFNKLII